MLLLSRSYKRLSTRYLGGVNDETIFYCKHPVLSIRRIHNRTNMVGFICISHRVPSMLGYGLRMGDGVI